MKKQYEVIWLDSNFNETGEVMPITISEKYIIMPNRCADSYRIDEKDICISHKEKCISSLKILFAYHNPKGDDFIIYENSLISHIGWENKVGRLRSIN